MNELKRCPFCGDEVEIVPTDLYHWKYAIHHKSKTECILDANAFALPYEKEDAVRMWNIRADRKTENISEKQNNCDTCKFELYCPEMCDGCCEWDSHYEPKAEPQTEYRIGYYTPTNAEILKALEDEQSGKE